MEAREITPRYFVTPQISVEDIPEIVKAGFKTVICNRPNEEVPPSHQAETIGQAAEAAGLGFRILPLTHQTMTPDNVAAQRSFYTELDAPILAYCASGTRCSVIWALGQASDPESGMDTDQILATTAQAGYALDGLRPTLDALSKD